MTEPHDPRPVSRIVIPLRIEIAPRGDAAIRYIGNAVHQVASPGGSEQISPADIADALAQWVRREADPADSMWEVTRIAPALDCGADVVAAARAAVASILKVHPAIRDANPGWFLDGTRKLVAAVDRLDRDEQAARERYDAAKTAGLSDHEAREDGWPT